MDSLLAIAVVLLPCLYLGITLLHAAAVFGPYARAGRAAAAALVLALGLHLALLTGVALRLDGLPATPLGVLLSATAAGIILVHLVALAGGRRPATAVAEVGLAFLFQLLASAIWDLDLPLRAVAPEPWLGLPTSLTIAAYTAFAVAAAHAVLFLGLYRELKRDRFPAYVTRLPPLESLERGMAGAVLIGLMALSFALALGALAARGRGAAWLVDPWTVGCWVTWGIFAAAVALRPVHLGRGPQAAFLCLGGLTWILSSLVAIHTVVPHWLGMALP